MTTLERVAMTEESGARSRRGVYGISVMAELSGVGPQTLRLYERRGLLTPVRTSGVPVGTAMRIWTRWVGSPR